MIISQNLTISALKAQLYGGVAFLIGAPLLVWPYQLIWNVDIFAKPDRSTLSGLFLFIATMFVGIVVHELIHGFTAVWYGRVRWQDIKFGVIWKAMTPYCHSTVPMTTQKYRVVVVMPLIVLIPYVMALVTGNGRLLAFGAFFTLAAIGDLMILWMVRNLRPDGLVQDHPSKVGLLIVSPTANLQ